MSNISLGILIYNYRKLATARTQHEKDECFSVINSPTYLDTCDWLSRQKGRSILAYSLDQLASVKGVFQSDKEFLNLFQKLEQAIAPETSEPPEEVTPPTTCELSPIRLAFLIGILEHHDFFAINEAGQIVAGSGIRDKEHLFAITRELFPGLTESSFHLKKYWSTFSIYRHRRFRIGKELYHNKKRVINALTPSYLDWSSREIEILLKTQTNPRKLQALREALSCATEERDLVSENLKRMKDEEK